MKQNISSDAAPCTGCQKLVMNKTGMCKPCRLTKCRCGTPIDPERIKSGAPLICSVCRVRVGRAA